MSNLANWLKPHGCSGAKSVSFFTGRDLREVVCKAILLQMLCRKQTEKKTHIENIIVVKTV